VLSNDPPSKQPETGRVKNHDADRKDHCAVRLIACCGTRVRGSDRENSVAETENVVDSNEQMLKDILIQMTDIIRCSDYFKGLSETGETFRLPANGISGCNWRHATVTDRESRESASIELPRNFFKRMEASRLKASIDRNCVVSCIEIDRCPTGWRL
jgi:hypothetical protein